MATQIDTLHAKQKHEAAEAMLAEFCPHYGQKKRIVDARSWKVLKANLINQNFIQ